MQVAVRLCHTRKIRLFRRMRFLNRHFQTIDWTTRNWYPPGLRMLSWRGLLYLFTLIVHADTIHRLSLNSGRLINAGSQRWHLDIKHRFIYVGYNHWFQPLRFFPAMLYEIIIECHQCHSIMCRNWTHNSLTRAFFSCQRVVQCLSQYNYLRVLGSMICSPFLARRIFSSRSS